MSPNTALYSHFAPCLEFIQDSTKDFETPSFLVPNALENQEDEAVEAILRAAIALANEDEEARFVPEPECTQKGMESKSILEQLSMLMFDDRHEVEKQLRSSSKSSSSSFDRVAKWIVRNEIEAVDNEMESVYDAAIFKFDIFKRWVEDEETVSETYC